jgi:hypothetical protein
VTKQQAAIDQRNATIAKLNANPIVVGVDQLDLTGMFQLAWRLKDRFPIGGVPFKAEYRVFDRHLREVTFKWECWSFDGCPDTTPPPV